MYDDPVELERAELDAMMAASSAMAASLVEEANAVALHLQLDAGEAAEGHVEAAQVDQVSLQRYCACALIPDFHIHCDVSHSIFSGSRPPWSAGASFLLCRPLRSSRCISLTSHSPPPLLQSLHSLDHACVQHARLIAVHVPHPNDAAAAAAASPPFMRTH